MIPGSPGTLSRLARLARDLSRELRMSSLSSDNFLINHGEHLMSVIYFDFIKTGHTWRGCRPCRHTSRSWWGSAGSGWWSRAPRWSPGGWPSPQGRSFPRPSHPCSSSRCCTLRPDSNIKQLPSPLWHYLRSTLVICHQQRGQHNLWKSQKNTEKVSLLL